MGLFGRDNPLLGYNFRISLLESSSSLAVNVATIAFQNLVDRASGGFSECSGLEMTMDVEDYMEGGNNSTVLKFPTRIKWNDITLKKGLTLDTELWDWFDGFVQGRGERKDGLIILNNEAQLPQVAWGFRRGLPIKYTAPSMNASQNEVAVESIQIAHEGLYQIQGLGAASGIVSAIGNAFS